MTEEYVKEGEKIIMMTEMYPLIVVATGEIIDWRVLRSFRVNNPKKKEENPIKEKLKTEFEEEERL